MIEFACAKFQTPIYHKTHSNMKQKSRSYFYERTTFLWYLQESMK